MEIIKSDYNFFSHRGVIDLGKMFTGSFHFFKILNLKSFLYFQKQLKFGNRLQTSICFQHIPRFISNLLLTLRFKTHSKISTWPLSYNFYLHQSEGVRKKNEQVSIWFHDKVYFFITFLSPFHLSSNEKVAKWVSNIYYLLRTPQNNNKQAVVSGPVGEMEDTFQHVNFCNHVTTTTEQ